MEFFQKQIHGVHGTASSQYPIDSAEDLDGSVIGEEVYKYPVINYSPEEIFANKVPLLDINFIKPSSNDDRNSAHVLQETIAGWYVALRTLALVGMLSVLVYVGIKILLSSVAADKAKYKTMLKDWVVGICILLFLHYIMYFILVSAEELTKLIGGDNTNSVLVTIGGTDSFTTNLMGLSRLLVQHKDTWLRIIYLAIYGFMTWFSVRFTWMYIKRVATMAFLTILAPLVAFMYAIDKLGGGTVGFNNLIKQYFTNAFMQPVHRLIYTVLITSAMSLATANPIYAIVVLALISKATDLVFSEFITFGGKTGGALGMGLLAGTASAGSKAKGKDSKSSSGGKDKVRTKPSPEDRSGKDKLSKSGRDDRGLPPPTTRGEAIEESERGDDKNTQGESLEHPNEATLPDHILNDEEKQREEAENTLRNNFEGTSGDNEDPKESELPNSSGGSNTQGGRAFYGSRTKGTNTRFSRKAEKQANKAIRKASEPRRLKGIAKTLPGVVYKGARGAGKVATGAAFGVAGAGFKVAGAMVRGDANVLARGAEGFKSGARIGGKGFDATAGRLADATLGRATGGRNSLAEQYRKSAYGSITNYKNATSDKAFMKDKDTDDYMRTHYEKGEIKQKKKDFVDYRQATGVIDKDTIRKALKNEEETFARLQKATKNDKGTNADITKENKELARAVGQNAAALASKNKISDQAWSDEKVYKAEQKNIADTLDRKKYKEDQRMALADEIMKSIKNMKYS